MTAYVALLRAVNVGGRNRVPMAELRSVLGAAGLEDVSTVLQSGNALFRSGESESVVAHRVGNAIDKALGLRVGIVVRSADEIGSVTDRNPFLAGGRKPDPVTLHVAFLSKRPAAAAAAALDPDRSPSDAFVVDGREVYLSYVKGSGRSRLTLDYLERTLGVEGTARNWRTVQRLAAGLAELAR